MFGEWLADNWLILVVDIAAIVIVVMFLKSRIQLKLKEVEARQAHERLMRKEARKNETEEDP
ncbi:MAG: hypothetical protein CMO41_04940 [Verrucomicrobiales bacterium]|nr:hypothetical protein [Verrucomicrobiales bacterium]DAC46452.1 MAG TPA: hypothetical protein D7H92_06550 [Candidatus Poseidoniales archaeon]|tara:strand:+ start:1428 stop:1613 length:186 start_codon:yes stop_codon:yes gene_type:complete